MMASGMFWKVEILQRLQNRDRQEFVSFKDLIKSRMYHDIYFVFYVHLASVQTFAFLLTLLTVKWLVTVESPTCMKP